MEVQQAYRRRSSRWDCRIRYTAIFSLPVCAIPATFAVKPFPRSSPLNGTKSSNTSSPWIARCAPSATRCSGRSTVWTITRASIIVGRNRAGYRRVCSDRAEETLCEKTSLVVEKERKKGRKKEREEKKKERKRKEGRREGNGANGRQHVLHEGREEGYLSLITSSIAWPLEGSRRSSQFFLSFSILVCSTRVTVAFVVVPFFRRLNMEPAMELLLIVNY